ncbi:uncharacterized protein [Dysidea avara]|uniref:uncharacterized protein isoform X2 n=1 Tax=Dysidea avara TaxID=196820 RepID=UPI00331AF3E4
MGSYNSLQDKHLTEFYSSDHPQRLRHLIGAGLITKEGYIVNDTTLRLKNALKQQKRPALANGSIDLPGSKAVKAKILANQSHTTAQLTQTKTIIGRIPHSPYLSRSFSTCKPLPLQPKSSHKRSQTLPSVQTMYTTHCYPMRSGVHVTLRYLGQSVHLEGSVKHDTVDVVIMQQPCFGDTVCVFDGKVKLKGQFTFTSRRHLDCPFGVSIFLDHMFDCRLSTCCEYKHQPRKILGSKTSHFYLVKVEGGKACCKCQGTADPPSMNKKTTNEVSPIPVKDSKESNMQINVDDNRCKSKNQANSPDTFEFGADKSPPTNDNNVVSPSHSRDVPSSQENSVEQPPIVKRSVVFSPDTKDDQETITLNNAKECSR